MVVPRSFLDAPFAHRGLHNLGEGRTENSLSAMKAAVEAGYGIELDVQLTRDGHAVGFHDYDLDRMTCETGPVRERDLSEVREIALSGGGGTIPSLPDVLKVVGGAVPILLEVKDQDGALGADVGPLERAVARDLKGYDGEVALMSFNPHSVGLLSQIVPERPRGLVTDAYDPDIWPLPNSVLAHLREIPDYERVGASFISHAANDLTRARVSELKAGGATVFCWTIRSPKEEAEARKVADNVTFEGYLPGLPA